MLDVRCPGCAKLLQVAETATDYDSLCPACGTEFRPERAWSGAQSLPPPQESLPSSLPGPQTAVTVSQPSNDLDGRWPNNMLLTQSAVRASSPSVGRLGCISFLVGCALSILLAVRLDRMFLPAEAIVWLLGTGFVTGSFAMTFAVMLANAAGTWQRWAYRIGIVSALAAAAGRCCWIFLTPAGHYPEDLTVAFLVAGLLGLAGCVFLLILGKAAETIVALRGGFLKAAGRPTAAVAITRYGHPFDDRCMNEDFT
jgi:hypothetical protein